MIRPDTTLRAMLLSGSVRWLGVVALAAICFEAVAAIQRSEFEFPFGLNGGAKIETYREERMETDALIFGSSYLAHALNPALIDPTVSRRIGRPFRSLNLAMAGARGLEVDHLLRDILDDPPVRLRWVVIEAPTFEGWIRETWRTPSRRMIYWHTARQTRIALSQLRFESIPWSEKLELALLHLRLFALRVTNLGTGIELFQSITGWRPARHDLLLDKVRGMRGYASLESLEVLGPERSEPRLKFESEPDEYWEAIQSFDADEVGPEFEHYRPDVLDEQIRFLEARGITPIYVVPPHLIPSAGFRELAREGRIPNLLFYADPVRYPDFYHPANRWDAHHTSKRGSRLWSAHFGRDLAALIRKRETGE